MKALSKGRSDMTVSTLFTGSSYGLYGVDERLISNAVNMSVPAQDLYYSFKGVSEVCKQNPNIRNVVVCCGYYYFFVDMSAYRRKDIKNKISTLYDRIYGDIHNGSFLPPELKFLAKSNLFDIERIYKYRTFALSKTYFNEDYPRLDKERIKECTEWKNLSVEKREKAVVEITDRFNKYYKWKYTWNENIDILNKFSKFCSDRNINLLFVVTPVTEMFRKYLNPKFKPCFYEALENAPGVIHFLDLYDSQDYSDSDFIDHTHLDDSGAEKLTRTILATLDEINEA
jgi:hypothetical protein